MLNNDLGVLFCSCSYYVWNWALCFNDGGKIITSSYSPTGFGQSFWISAALTFRLDGSFLQGIVLCAEGYLAAYLASNH